MHKTTGLALSGGGVKVGIEEVERKHQDLLDFFKENRKNQEVSYGKQRNVNG